MDRINPVVTNSSVFSFSCAYKKNIAHKIFIKFYLTDKNFCLSVRPPRSDFNSHDFLTVINFYDAVRTFMTIWEFDENLIILKIWWIEKIKK